MGYKIKNNLGKSAANRVLIFSEVYIVSFYDICLELLFMWAYTFEK